MLEHADQESLHDLKDGLAGEDQHETSITSNSSHARRQACGQRCQHRLSNLERVHYGDSYTKLTNLFDDIKTLI